MEINIFISKRKDLWINENNYYLDNKEVAKESC